MNDTSLKVVWRIGKQIGDPSGFGKVFEAKKEVNGETQKGEYVIKKLVKSDEDSIARFKREVRYLTKLDHPRIVKAEGYGLSTNPYFYAMLKYETSLQSIIPELSEDYERIQIIFNRIFEGLEYLHNEGYYHRDLKPANVLYNSDSDLVLCDLGLCINFASDDSTRLTVTNVGIGTRFYCSPEQEADLKHVDQRTDIYSVGKMIYEAFTGERPSILDFNQLPAAMQYVVKKSTKEDRNERFEAVDELRQHFNTAMELLIDATSKDDLLSVINQVNSVADFTLLGNDSLIDKLAHLLDGIGDEVELQEMIMKISGTVFRPLEDKFPDLFKQLMNEFIQTINSQGWPFSYTDTLANKFEEIYSNIRDIDIKGEILKGMLSLGTGHNRWYVMHKFIKLLEEIDDEAEMHSIYHILSSEDYDLKRINSTINIDKNDLNPIIRRLFEF
ncbi:serine/threonine-protein kinase [Virgibacillus sp. FSP13]